MSVRIQPGDSQPEWPEDGYQPDPYLDRVDGPDDIRAVFADDEAQRSDGTDSGERLPLGLRRPRRGSLLGWSGAGRPPWTRAVAVAVVGSLAVLVLGVLVLRIAGPGKPAGPAVAPQPEASAAPTPPLGEGEPDRAPARDVTAVSWQGAALPVSATAGPRVFDDVRAYGFSHDELGAALAAVHVTTHIDAYAGPPVFVPALKQQTVGAPRNTVAATRAVYENAARERGIPPARIRQGVPVLDGTGDFRGWRVPDYSPDGTVVVELLVRTPMGSLQQFQVPVVWREGDWKVQLHGAHVGRLLRVTSAGDTNGFTPFTSTPNDRGTSR